MATKTQVLNWFRGELGYVEGRGNRTKYAKKAGHANGQAWCATFMVAGFKSVGMKLGIGSAYTPSLLNSLEDGKIGGPAVGAIAFLYFPSLGRVAHCGIVESVRSDGRFVSIEGNTDVAGGRTGGKVMRKVRSTSNFTFVMPKYSNDTAVKPAPKPQPEKYYGNCVLLQKAVRVTADNQWGEGTEKACNAVRWAAQKKFPYGVKFAQGVVGVKADGAWGGVSRRALQATILEMQYALIQMSHTKFARTGLWDTPTETAYHKVREICKRF
jgi:hypothetical protein